MTVRAVCHGNQAHQGEGHDSVMETRPIKVKVMLIHVSHVSRADLLAIEEGGTGTCMTYTVRDESSNNLHQIYSEAVLPSSMSSSNIRN